MKINKFVCVKNDAVFSILGFGNTEKEAFMNAFYHINMKKEWDNFEEFYNFEQKKHSNEWKILRVTDDVYNLLKYQDDAYVDKRFVISNDLLMTLEEYNENFDF